VLGWGSRTTAVNRVPKTTKAVTEPKRVPVDPDSIRTGERVPHGGESDRNLLDFSANTNPHTPDGVADVYAGALEESRRYPDDDYPEFGPPRRRSSAAIRTG